MLFCRGEVRESGLTGLTRNQVSLTAPGVRIPPSPPSSPSPFAVWPQMSEIRACAANFVDLVAAEKAPDPRFRQFATGFIRGNQIRGQTKNAVDGPSSISSLLRKDPLLRIPFDREMSVILQALG